MMFNASIRKPSVARAFAPQTRVVRKTSSLKVQAFKVTLETPSGTETLEVDEDVYILDAAEARPPPSLMR